NFRAVAYECTAEVFTAPSTVAEVLRKTLDRYEPAKDYEPVEDSDFYGPRLRRLAAVRMQVVKVHAKFKVGPYGPPALKSHVADQLQKRSRPGDQRAAEVISRYALGEV
ncbi:MAG TPA: hypothetical protein VEJ84_19200, partial [Acidimicrobiales bacterium]|nr:hypothetical protein [Acidimicrobiales bacterium]